MSGQCLVGVVSGKGRPKGHISAGIDDAKGHPGSNIICTYRLPALYIEAIWKSVRPALSPARIVCSKQIFFLFGFGSAFFSGSKVSSSSSSSSSPKVSKFSVAGMLKFTGSGLAGLL